MGIIKLYFVATDGSDNDSDCVSHCLLSFFPVKAENEIICMIKY